MMKERIQLDKKLKRESAKLFSTKIKYFLIKTIKLNIFFHIVLENAVNIATEL